MILNKPEVEFVQIETDASIMTVSGTQGGDRCTGVEVECGEDAEGYITCTEDINGYV